jgi:YD repeat-containing protein
VLVRAEHVMPNGNVWRLESYDRISGRLVTTVLDVHREAIETVELSTKGVRTVTARSGVVGRDGCHHHDLTFDARGRVERSACLDDAGRPVADDEGCEVTTRTYGDADEIVAKECFDAAGAPADFANGDHRRATTYDAEGRPTVVASFDRDAKAIAGLDGCASKVTAYDARSSRIATKCLDLAGLVVHENRFTVDAAGCNLREEKLDAHGAAESLDGFATHVWKRNELCDAIYDERRDAKGNFPPDVAARTSVYDVHGWVTEERCVDVGGKPASCQYARDAIGSLVKYVRDDRGRATTRRAFGADGKPSKASSSYPHEFRFTYGTDGRLASAAYFEFDGTPGLGNGVHRIEFANDSVGKELSRKFFGVTGSPIANGGGCHEFRTEYDEHHLFAQRSCLDASGALTANSSCLDNVCWRGAARVVVVRTPGETFDVFYDTKGIELRRISCSQEKCHQ